MATGKSKVIRRVLTGLVVVIGVLICAGAWYVSDYYHAEEYAMEVVADRDGDGAGFPALQDAFGTAKKARLAPVSHLCGLRRICGGALSH